jgi:hypothetical protein
MSHGSNKSVFITQDTNKIDAAFGGQDDSDDESEIIRQYEASDELIERPISAVAPKVQQRDERQIEVSSTPAFQCLEEVSIPQNLDNCRT